MRLYLSSTLSDLQDERRAVKDVLSGAYTVAESYEADPRPLWQSCVADVASCAIYIGIVGLRYGFVPPGQGKSITELEFDAALAAGLRCFVFVKEEAAVLLPFTDLRTQENDPALIEAFRARLSSGANDIPRAALFTSAEDLKVKVLRALQRQPAPAPAEPIVEPPSLAAAEPAAAPAMTELQKLLWSYLQQNWPTLSRQQSFTRARLLAGIAGSPSAEAVFDLARSAPVERLLVATRRFFLDRGSRAWANSSPTDAIVCSAIVRIALVAAERHFEAPCKAEAQARSDHDPMLSRDRLVATIEAATRLGFGLCFSPGKHDPENVFPLVHPVPEPGVRDEEGLALSRSELWATIQRRSVDIDRKLSPGYLRELIRELEEDLGTALVVSSNATGRFASGERRAELQAYLRGDFGVRSFFRQPPNGALPDWVKTIESDLRETFGPILQPLSPPDRAKDDKAVESDPEASGPPPPTDTENAAPNQAPRP
jgi:hypothetical protein